MRFDIQCRGVLGALKVPTFTRPGPRGHPHDDDACLYSVNNEYRDQFVTLGGAGRHASAAGATATLSARSLATLPPSLPKTAMTGIFKA